MKRHNKLTLGFIVGGIVSIFAVIGSTAGSLAWYVYSRSVRVGFVGTSVAKSALLNVGIVDDAHYLTDAKVAQYELTREEFDGHSIVFTHATDGLDYHVIQDYLFRSPYAVDLLFPLTTQERSITDTSDLTLYESPLHGDTTINRPAIKTHYVVLPLAFRMTDTNGHNMHDVDIWLTSANVQASGEQIDESLRLFVKNSQRKFLMKPADKGMTTGRTKVGGLLDLDGDGTYDYNLSNNKELYYGQYTGTLAHSTTPYDKPKETAPYDNVNGVTNLVESTFYSKHSYGSYCVDLEQLTPKVAEYESFGTVKPMINSEGKYYEGTTGKVITSTDSTDGIGYVTFTIFIEGWDHVVIDQAANYSFNLSLKFETNRD